MGVPLQSRSALGAARRIWYRARQGGLPLLLAVLGALSLAIVPGASVGQASRIYAVWPHSDYKPWQSDIYAREPDFVLRELDWMWEVGITTYLPLALSSGRVNWPSDRFPDTRALFGERSPLDAAVLGGDERGIGTELYVLAGFVGFLEDPWAAPDLRANPEWDVVAANGRGTLSGAAGTATAWGTFLWWDLGHPAVQDRLLGMLAEALDRYPTIEGVHLDYIRDPGLGGCYSDACLGRFGAATGTVAARRRCQMLLRGQSLFGYTIRTSTSPGGRERSRTWCGASGRWWIKSDRA